MAFLLFMFYIVVGTTTATPTENNCPEDLTCGNQVIKFPFQIKNHNPNPSFCGYPGFDLFCSSNKETMIELPHKVKLKVKNIDYTNQTIELSDPQGCLYIQFHNLNLSSSHFKQVSDTRYFYDKVDSYHFFNCSLLIRDDDMDSYLVPCLSTSTSQTYAIPAYEPIKFFPLTFCTKMYNVSVMGPSYSGTIPKKNFLRLKWSEPNCKHCESEGKRCDWKNTTSNSTNKEVYCFAKNNNKGSSTTLVNTGSILGSLFFVLLTGAIYHIYDSYIQKKEKQAIIEKFLEDYRALKPTRYSYEEIKRITNNFGDKLGQGAYGTVYRGSISKEIIVAVKILNVSQGNGQDFLNEVGTMGRIHHVNIVRLVGFCADGFKRALIYEFLPNGSLQKFINSPENKKNFLGWKKLHEIALGIAKGVEYLHQGCDQRIVHFDIKPQNVLLDHNFIPKISDFGLAKLCSRDQSIVSMTAARGTLGYIAPEVFSRNFGNVSYKSDVYSYGMMLLETIGGKKITEDLEENSSHVYYPEWIYNLIDDQEEMRIQVDDEGDEKIARKMAIVGLWCIQWHAMHRPTMQMVVQMLEGDVDKTPIPPNPFASQSRQPRRNGGAKITRQLTQELDVIQELD
ncbi:putative glycerophosphodiester phosphodiesterase, protein kinase RLK-Pelle-LRK10L-2 family [Medicago truncatula]|uniref:Putative glycerophosphodiester phosphodiesterase, protein kinase RLK-Pelle-LRK10L-2 family n=1 Tax=Medicago truncatula TaxID=3880 RepID=G7I961_MEDTR|nr:rust resistance kinase Lr10 [Medicago truncatula]AES59881.2 receptor-like kinase [Medicago truncatula]RHN77980.1 putative glycerophosphodiester phosphodiesterase, protein kinase RLK-Pelle-LRK10L-2 family [Medicago truncatula]